MKIRVIILELANCYEKISAYLGANHPAGSRSVYSLTPH